MRCDHAHSFNLSVAVAFSIWSPLVLVFSAAICPCWLFACEMVHLLDRVLQAHPDNTLQQRAYFKRLDFCIKFCCFVLVPIPRHVFTAASLSLRLAIIATLADFGFSYGTWIMMAIFTVFDLARRSQVVWMAPEEQSGHVEVQNEAALHPHVPTSISFEHRSAWDTSCVSFTSSRSPHTLGTRHTCEFGHIQIVSFGQVQDGHQSDPTRPSAITCNSDNER